MLKGHDHVIKGIKCILAAHSPQYLPDDMPYLVSTIDLLNGSL